MAKYMQDSTDIQINEVSGTDNINFSFKSGNSIDTKIGDLTQLTTDDKSSLVNAINEINTGNSWLDVPLSEGITTPGLGSSGNLMYRKIGKIVFIKGSVKGFTALNQAFGTLPVGYRPPTRIDCYGSYSGTKTANVIIGNNGVMTLVNNQEGTITSANWVTVCTSFIAE